MSIVCLRDYIGGTRNRRIEKSAGGGVRDRAGEWKDNKIFTYRLSLCHLFVFFWSIGSELHYTAFSSKRTIVIQSSSHSDNDKLCVRSAVYAL